MQKSIAIYGAGGFGREVLMLLRQLNLKHQEWNIIGFFDDNTNLGDTIEKLPVLGTMAKLNHFENELYMVAAVGGSHVRAALVQLVANKNIKFATLLHPSVEVHDFQNITIAEGAIICAGNILTTGISIGKHVVLNLKCTVGHDVVLEDFVSLMPGCHISGNVKIGEGAYLGTGAVVLNGIEIGAYATIGA